MVQSNNSIKIKIPEKANYIIKARLKVDYEKTSILHNG